MEISVIRHSQTQENLQGICQGQTNGTLSDRGKEQARELAHELKQEGIAFDMVISSDLGRAVETAKIIFGNHPEIVTDKRLRERGLPPIEGKKLLPTVDYVEHIDGCESMQEMFERVQDLLDEIKKKHHNKRIALVSHGLTIRVITSLCEEVEIHETTLVGNCSLTKFRIAQR